MCHHVSRTTELLEHGKSTGLFDQEMVPLLVDVTEPDDKASRVLADELVLASP
jgi:hypothetical protein